VSDLPSQAIVGVWKNGIKIATIEQSATKDATTAILLILTVSRGVERTRQIERLL